MTRGVDVLEGQPVDPPPDGLVCRERPDRVPLSFSQRRLWFLERWDPEAASYNEHVAVRLTQQQDRAALELALGDVVSRHEVLRTTLPDVDGVPYQAILPAEQARPSLRVQRTSADRLEADIRAEVARPFSLAAEIPLRATLFDGGGDLAVLVIVIHHVAVDGWSIRRIIVPELARAYAARRAGRMPQLAPPRIQYADYALWQTELFAEGRTDGPLAAQLSYWTTRLAGLPTAIRLPVDHPRSALRPARGASLRLSIPPQLHVRIAALARRRGATVYMTLSAALAALLGKLGAGEDVPFGSPIAGRASQSVADLVGPVANTLVLRLDTSGDPTFGELVSRAKECVLGACEHSELPFERLVSALNPPRIPSIHPLFQVMLAFQSVKRVGSHTTQSLVDQEFSRFTTLGSRARFDLTFDLIETRGRAGAPLGIRGVIEYNASLFEQATISSLKSMFLRLLSHAVDHPDLRLSQIAAAAFDDSQPSPSTIAGRADTNRPTGVLAAVSRCLSEQPDATAVIEGGVPISRRAFATAVTAASGLLRRHGVARGAVIGLALPPSASFGAVLVAAWQAGATCLVLDPGQSSAGLAARIARVRPAVIVTTAAIARALPGSIPTAHVDEMTADRPGVVVDEPSPQALAILVADETDPAGSIGFTFESLAHAVTSLTHLVPNAVDHWVGLSHVGSLRSVFDWCAALSAGAALVLPAEAEALVPAALAAGLTPLEGSVLAHGVPERVRPVMSCMSERRSNLVVVTGGGIRLSPGSVDEILTGAGRCFHVAASSEIAGWISGAEIVAGQGHPSVGTPPVSARMYILDDRLQPVPEGAPGELYVGGPQICQGYFGEPGRTASRCVADPLRSDGSRMVRSGMWACRRASAVYLLGARTDQDGRHIDAAVALERLPAVRDAIVLPAQADRGPCACVVPREGHDIDEAVVAQQMEIQIGRSELPVAVTVFPDWPRTADAAIDSAAIAARADASRPATSSWSPEETGLRRLFAEALSRPDIGPDDDFFALGGHSLLVVQLLERIHAEFGVEIGVRQFFNGPTVALVASVLRNAASMRTTPPPGSESAAGSRSEVIRV